MEKGRRERRRRAGGRGWAPPARRSSAKAQQRVKRAQVPGVGVAG